MSESNVHKKGRERLNVWKNRIAVARIETERRAQHWERALKIYEAEGDDSGLKIPFMFAVYSTVLPMLFNHMPRIVARAKNPRDIQSAGLVEAIIENESDRIDLYGEILQAVYSSILFGVGFVKLGVEIKTEIVEKPASAFNMHPVWYRAKKLLERLGKSGMSEEIVTQEGVWVDYVDPKDILLDPEAKKLESCRFIAHRILLTKDEFEKRFGKKRSAQTKKVSLGERDGEKPGDYMESGDSDRYEIFEIWSKEIDRRMVISEGCDEFLEDEPWPHEHLKDYPFESLASSLKLNSIYGISEILLHEDSARVIDNMINTREENAATSFSGFAYEKGAIDEDQMTKFEEPGQGKILEVNDISRIKPIQSTPVSEETYTLQQEMERLIKETAHVSSQQMQTRDKGKQTATEIRYTQQAGGILTRFKVRMIERFVERIVRKLVVLIKDNYDLPQLVRIQDRLGTDASFYEWTRSDIGEYTFSIKAGSAAYQDEQIIVGQHLEFLQLMGKLPLPNPFPLAKELILKIADIRGINIEVVNQAFEQPVQRRR